ncbi:MAG: DUF2330 domain-containing protein [Deltaproteobacteria bacterium]
MRRNQWGEWITAARVASACLAGGAGWLAVPGDATACGGCFNAGVSAPVVAHRMAFAISQERTVLWDQFQFSGSPDEFSWVLPVLPGAYLELSTDAWFEALDATTSITVQPPLVTCADRGSQGCGASDDDAVFVNDSAGVPGGGVAVLRRESIGPYETVTLRSSSGDELTGWLLDNGYIVPPDVIPIIAAYVSEGQDFIALKLRPNQGVQLMQPVRVITPNGPPILPLRMVAAGAAESVDIVVYVVGDRRFSMPDFTEVFVDPSSVSYDFAQRSSNYLELRQQALSFNGGQAVLTAYAAAGFFSAAGRGGPRFGNGFGGFVDTYFRQALGEASIGDRDQCSPVSSRTNDDRLVVPDCESARECNLPTAEQIPASQFACLQFEDLSAALLGQHPASTWLTRLELHLPRIALSSDCVFLPSADPAPVSNSVQATKFENPPCELPVFSSSLSLAPPRSVGAGLLAALLAGVVLRRAGRRGG